MTLLRRDKMSFAHWPFILLMLLLSAEVTNSRVQSNARNRREETDPRPPEETKPKPGEQLGKYTRAADGKVTLQGTPNIRSTEIYSAIPGACKCEVQRVKDVDAKELIALKLAYDEVAAKNGSDEDSGKEGSD